MFHRNISIISDHDSIQSSAAERDLLNASITEMAKELERLQLQRESLHVVFGCTCSLLWTEHPSETLQNSLYVILKKQSAVTGEPTETSHSLLQS